MSAISSGLFYPVYDKESYLNARKNGLGEHSGEFGGIQVEKLEIGSFP